MQNNSDKFDHLIALAASKCLDEDTKAFMDADTSDVQFDEDYYRKRKQAINRSKRRSTLRCTKAVAIRLLAAIMVMVMLSCALIGCVPKWRRAIFNAILEWYDNYFAVTYEDPDAAPAETRHPETTAAEPAESSPDEPAEIKAVPTYIEEVRKPRELPDGVWEDVLAQTSTGINIDYYSNEEYLFSFSQRVLKVNDKAIDSEDATVTYIKINGNDATIVKYANKSELNILWDDGEYTYHVFSTECDAETLIMYAKSVK